MIDAINTTYQAPCEGVTAINDVPRICSTYAFHVNLSAILPALTMTLMTK